MYQAMQSVKVKEQVLDVDGDVLLEAGQAGFVVADRSVVVNGVAEGVVEVKIDLDGVVYELDVNQIQGL